MSQVRHLSNDLNMIPIIDIIFFAIFKLYHWGSLGNHDLHETPSDLYSGLGSISERVLHIYNIHAFTSSPLSLAHKIALSLRSKIPQTLDTVNFGRMLSQ